MNLRKRTSALEKIRIGIDTGGTFTDFVVARGSRVDSFKIASTPHNPAEAILDGIARILATAGAAPSDIVHGTTVATNALLERKGGRTALLTTAGFEDVIEIGRQNRPEIYNLMVTRPAPLVPRELRFFPNPPSWTYAVRWLVYVVCRYTLQRVLICNRNGFSIVSKMGRRTTQSDLPELAILNIG